MPLFADVISFAKESGFYKGPDKNFNFADAYAPLDFGSLRACEARVWSAFNRVTKGEMEKYLDYAMGYDASKRMPLFVKPAEKLSVKEVAWLMRDHFEDTPMDMRNDIGAGGHNLPYRWRPMHFSVDGQEYLNERAIATQQTGFWMLGQALQLAARCRGRHPVGSAWTIRAPRASRRSTPRRPAYPNVSAKGTAT